MSETPASGEGAPQHAPTPTPPRAKPPRRRRRWPLRFVQAIFVAFAAAFALLVGWLHSDDFQRRSTQLAEWLIEQQTGEQATVNAVRVSLLPPSIAIDGFHLFHGDPDAADPDEDQTIAKAERIRVPIVLTGGRPGIGRIRIQSPVVQLHLEPDGKLREFRNLKHADPPKPLKRLPWSSLEITDGTVRFFYPQGAVALTDLDLTPTTTTNADLTGDLEVSVRGLTEKTHLALPGVTVGPELLEAPKIELRTESLDVTGSARHTLGGALAVDLSAQLRLDTITPALTPPRVAHGVVNVDVTVSGTPQDPTVRAVAWGTSLGLDLPGVFTPLLTYELGDAYADVIATKSLVRVEKAALHWGEQGKIVAWGLIDPKAKTVTEATVTADRLSLAHLLRAFDAAPNPWIDMSTDMEAHVTGTLQPLRLEGPFEFLVAKLQVGDRPIDREDKKYMLDIPWARAAGNLVVDKTHIVLDVDAVSPRNQGKATVDIGFGPRGPLDLQADMWKADLRDFQPMKGVDMTGRGRVTGHFWGPFNAIQFQGHGELDQFSVLGIPYADHISSDLASPHMKSIELHQAHARRGKTDYFGDFAMSFKPVIQMDTDVSFPAGRIEDAVGMFIDLDGMKGNLVGTLSLHGPLYDLDGGAKLQFSDIDLWGEHFEEGEAHGYLDTGVFTLDDLRVTRHGGDEGLVLRGSVERKWALNMELRGDGFALERLDHLKESGAAVSGKVSFQSQITNTLFDPSPDGRIVLTDTRYAGKRLADSVAYFDSKDGFATYAAVVLGGAATVDGTLGLWDEQPYHLVARLDKVPAHLLYPVAADGRPITAVASGRLEVGGHFGPVWSPVDLGLDLSRVAIDWGDHHLENTSPWRYTQTGNAFAVDGFNLHGDGTDFAFAAAGDPVSLQVDGSGDIDLDFLAMVTPGVEKAAGNAHVVLSATGQRPDVQAVVDVDFDAQLFRMSYAPVTFEDGKGHARITRDRIALDDLVVGIGGGTMTGGGVIDAVDWIPKHYDLAATVQNAQVQWVDSLPPAIGDAELQFDGPTDALLLSGDIHVDDMTFSDRMNWEDWVVSFQDWMMVDAAQVDEEAWFNLNVAINADHTVFLQNNVAEGTASADLRIIGDTARPGLVGEVRVDPGAVAFLQDREFRVDRGILLYNDPWSWDPELDFDLLTDITNQEQQYRVSYLVFGPFSNWQTMTRSDPPLPQADVNALLWFGVTTDQLESMGELPTAVVQSVADLFLADILLRSDAGQLKDELPDFLSPDRVDIQTGVNARGQYSPDPRLVIEKRLTNVGDTKLLWELNLVQPGDNYVSVERKIGGIWSLAGWYATYQRERVLPIGGAYGADVTARWESQ